MATNINSRSCNGCNSRGVTGMRIGETCSPIQPHKAAIYGIQVKHIQIYHKLYSGSGKYIIIEDNTSMDLDTLFTKY